MLVQTRLNLKKISVDVMTSILTPKEAIYELKNKNVNDKLIFKMSRSNLSIEFKKIKTLHGRIITRFSNLADGSIITLFDKTPFPEKNDDVVCPHFVELKWANGCNFDCAWCYLNGTLRFRPMGKKPYLKDINKIQNHLKNYFEQIKTPSILNSGELSDSLVYEGNGYALSKIIIPLFQEQEKHKLLILTKSANVKSILNSNAQENVIVSFSLNSFDVAKKWEKKAPTPEQRIKAAKKLFDAGYEVRIRIDPIVPYKNWENGYKELIDFIFENIQPERITIGSLRGLQSTINNSKDKSWVEYLDDSSNWGKKISFDKRHEMYKIIIEYLTNKYNYKKVGLCKETVEMWKKLGMDYKKIKCNCII